MLLNVQEKKPQVNRLAFLIISYIILISTMTNLIKNGGELLELRGSGSAIKMTVRDNSNRPGTLGTKPESQVSLCM